MARKKSDALNTKVENKKAWTAEEDRKLAQYIEVHGAKKWKTVAIKSGINRCGKSCRLRWMNYLRPNIKRGNISDQEEDLILRLHKLLGNRWSLIAGRLPGRTDNEIKNYWNSYLSKKINQTEKLLSTRSTPLEVIPQITCNVIDQVDGEMARQIEEDSGSILMKLTFVLKDPMDWIGLTISLNLMRIHGSTQASEP